MTPIRRGSSTTGTVLMRNETCPCAPQEETSLREFYVLRYDYIMDGVQHDIGVRG